MNVKITLRAGSSANVDNFTIYACVSGGSPASVATGISRAQLIAGYTVNVPAATTGGTVNSTGSCTSYADWSVTPATLCYGWNADISQDDINAAVGNTGGFAKYNGLVLIDYINCDGTAVKYLGGLSGPNQSFCAKGIPSDPYYYNNNNQSAAGGSTISSTTEVCAG